MIEIWPSIDIIDKKNVKLVDDDFSHYEEMPLTPEEAIAFFQKQQCVTQIQLIDLFGAKNHEPTQMEYIRYLSARTTLPLQVGGGIQTIETIDFYLSHSVSSFVIGTKGMTDFLWLKQVCSRYPEKIYLSIDADGNNIAISGRFEENRLSVKDTLSKVQSFKLGGIIYTDITKDGKLLGPNIEMAKSLVESSTHPIIVSGGIRNYEDIKSLEAIGAHAAVVGKAAYQPSFWEGFVHQY